MVLTSGSSWTDWLLLVQSIRNLNLQEFHAEKSLEFVWKTSACYKPNSLIECNYRHTVHITNTSLILMTWFNGIHRISFPFLHSQIRKFHFLLERGFWLAISLLDDNIRHHFQIARVQFDGAFVRAMVIGNRKIFIWMSCVGITILTLLPYPPMHARSIISSRTLWRYYTIRGDTHHRKGSLRKFLLEIEGLCDGWAWKKNWISHFLLGGLDRRWAVSIDHIIIHGGNTIDR